LGGGADKLIISSHVLLETERKRKKQESDIDATRDEGERKGKLNQNSVMKGWSLSVRPLHPSDRESDRCCSKVS
jgi:hypothetical protein